MLQRHALPPSVPLPAIYCVIHRSSHPPTAIFVTCISAAVGNVTLPEVVVKLFIIDSHIHTSACTSALPQAIGQLELG